MALGQAPAAVGLGDLIDGLDAAVAGIAVEGLELDSRRLEPGFAFIAVPGEVHDGRDYLAAARDIGAAVIIAERGLTDPQRAAAGSVPVVELPGLASSMGSIADRYYGSPSRAMHLAAVTGTNGKTTTAHLAAQLLRSARGQCGVVGTLGAALDDRVADAPNTTPDALSLQRQLADWLAGGVKHAVLEVSSHALVQGRVNGLVFHTAVFTNLTHDHLDYHGGMDSYGEAKSLLFTHPELAQSLINLDDPFADRLCALSGAPVLGYSLSREDADIRAGNIRCHDGGVEAQLHTPWGSGILRSPLPGHFNLSNLLAAIGVACVEGVALSQALDAAPGLRPVTGRMELVANDRGIQLVIDYAHTPEALRQVLEALRAHASGRLICVFGCGGDRDRAKRPLMGAVASAHADVVVVTSDNPRTEPPQDIIDDIRAGVRDGTEMKVETDRARAISLAVDMAVPGDCVLVAGKGHESSQQVGSKRLPFSDREQLRLALRGGGAA